MIKRAKEKLSERFDTKDLRKLSYFLNWNVDCPEPGEETCPIQEETWMGQPTYTEQLLKQMGMNDCKPVKTLMDAGNHLVKAAGNEMAVNQREYQSLVGSLMYLARPDIAFAVGTLARFSSKPNQTHWTAAKRALRYLKGTRDLGIIFCGYTSESACCLGRLGWGQGR